MFGKKIVFGGTITRGLGEGTYFMSMPHYRSEIKKKLGFSAYPGTLNFKVAKVNLRLLRWMGQIKIEGYKSGGKVFGGITCYRSRLGSVEGAIIIPDLTRHKGVLEFIAPVHLKSELKLSDGDKIEVELLKEE